MAILLAACVTAFLITFLALPVIIKYSLSKNFVDIPGGRKIHKKVTPSLGGIGIFLGFAAASFFWMDFEQWDNIRFVMFSLFIVFLIGVRDDLVPIRALHKLYGQIIAVIVLLFSTVRIDSFYGLFGIEEINPVLSSVLTVVTIVVIMNSFNLIDGLDGLAGSVGLIALLAFGVWFFMAGEYTYSLFAFALIGAVVAFLFFNWEPSVIFMGDTGAMLIGMMLAIMAIQFMKVNDGLSDSEAIKFAGSISGASAMIIIPLCDTLRIIIVRLSKGLSPFRPDKSHIHHSIMRLGVSHARTAMILASVHIGFIILVWLLRDWPDEWLIPIIVGVAVALSIVLDRIVVRRKLQRN